MYLYIDTHKTKEKVEFESDSLEKILSELKKLDFNNPFHVILTKETGFLNIENKDGFCLIHFRDRTDESFKDIKFDSKNSYKVHQILRTFITEKESYKTATTFKKHHKEQERNKKERFEKWKVKYNNRRKSQRFDYLKPLAISVTIVTIVILAGYYVFTGEYKFIGQKTSFVRAEIIDTEMVHFWGQYYHQRIVYIYEFNNEKYQGAWVIDKRIGKKQVGDIVSLKIAVNYPKRSKVIGHY